MVCVCCMQAALGIYLGHGFICHVRECTDLNAKTTRNEKHCCGSMSLKQAKSEFLRNVGCSLIVYRKGQCEVRNIFITKLNPLFDFILRLPIRILPPDKLHHVYMPITSQNVILGEVRSEMFCHKISNSALLRTVYENRSDAHTDVTLATDHGN